jgi:hypothetical protein
MEDEMKSVLKFVAHSVTGGVTQHLSHGRKKRVAFCHINNANRMRVILPEGKAIRVRYITRGLMFAGFVPTSSAPVRKVPQSVQKVATSSVPAMPAPAPKPTPVHIPLTAPAPMRAPAPTQMQSLIAQLSQRGNLSHEEVVRRAEAIRGYRG